MNVAVIKVLFSSPFMTKDEIVLLTSNFKYLICVNNTSNDLEINYPDIQNFSVVQNYNNGGLAGAYNLAISYLLNIKPEYVLFLDDDTPYQQLLTIYQDDYFSSFSNPNVAAVAPTYIDLVSKTKGSHLLLNKFTFRRIPRDSIGKSLVSFIINSGSVWKFNALNIIGKYDEQMQVDHIDTDYCLRASKMGFVLILNSEYQMAHKIGNRISYRLLYFRFRSGNHSPYRRNMIFKNSILILKKHSFYCPAMIYVISERLIYELLGIIMAERDKFSKIGMCFRGLFQGFFIRKNSQFR